MSCKSNTQFPLKTAYFLGVRRLTTSPYIVHDCVTVDYTGTPYTVYIHSYTLYLFISDPLISTVFGMVHSSRTAVALLHKQTPCFRLLALTIMQIFVIKPTTAQLHLYTLRHVLAVTIRPSSGSMFFLLDKAAYGTLVLINIYVYNCCHMLKAYFKIAVDIHKKQLKSIKICLQISCCQYVGRTQIVCMLCVSQVPNMSEGTQMLLCSSWFYLKNCIKENFIKNCI
jgi:hypothetical protein